MRKCLTLLMDAILLPISAPPRSALLCQPCLSTLLFIDKNGFSTRYKGANSYQ